jgi:hypothetical protein
MVKIQAVVKARTGLMTLSILGENAASSIKVIDRIGNYVLGTASQ